MGARGEVEGVTTTASSVAIRRGFITENENHSPEGGRESQTQLQSRLLGCFQLQGLPNPVLLRVVQATGSIDHLCRSLREVRFQTSVRRGVFDYHRVLIVVVHRHNHKVLVAHQFVTWEQDHTTTIVRTVKALVPVHKEAGGSGWRDTIR